MRRLISVAALLALVLVLAACGGKKGTVPETTAPPIPPAAGTSTGPSVPEGPAAKKTVLTISAQGAVLRYDKSTLEAPAGTVTIVFHNHSSMQHDVALKGNGVAVQGPLVKDGGTSSVTAVLRPGRYEYYCTVPGHAAAGMRGTLVVK